MRGKADDEVTPQGAAHRDPIREQARVLDLVARGRDRRAEIVVVARVVHPCIIASNSPTFAVAAATVRRSCLTTLSSFPAKGRNTSAWAAHSLKGQPPARPCSMKRTSFSM